MKMMPKYRVTFFVRLILSYTILAVVMIGLAGGYLYIQANQLMVGEIEKDNQNRLITAKDYVENTLLRKFENSLRNMALSTISFQNNSALNYLLDNKWEGNSSRIVLFRQDLELFKLANEGASNITVHFRAGNYVVDNNFFYMLPGNSKDAAFIGRLKYTASNSWMTRTLPDGTQAMTYVIELPYGTPSKWSKGYMFVDVDMEYIKTMTAKIMSSPLERLYIFDSERTMVVQTAEADSMEIQLLQEGIGSSMSVNDIYSNKNGKFVLSYLGGLHSRYGWTYEMIRPINSFSLASEQFKTKIFVSSCLVLMFGILISYLISKQFYIPMKKLVHNIRSLYQPNLTNVHLNEYAFIGSALNLLGQKIVTLESRAKTNEIKNLVLGASLGLGLEHLEGLPQRCRYLVAHIRILEGNIERFQLHYEPIAFCKRYEIVSLNPNEAALIFIFDSTDEINEERIRSDFYRVNEGAGGEIRFGVSIGTVVQSLEEISISYQYAQQAYRYRFIYGPEAIVSHSKISSFNSAPYMFNFDLYKNVLKAGNTNGANRFIDEFDSIIKERSLQLEAVELALLQLVSTLYQVVIELDLQQLVPPSNLFDELKKDTLAATIDSIRSLSERIAVHVRDSGNHAHTDVILKLKTYIDEHLHEELSLNILSEVASLAPAYISTLFGEVMMESFTEYVTRARLDKAAGLLHEDARLSIAEIAFLVGYRNPQYFHNKFKARFGITPVQYRLSKNTVAPAH